MRPWPADDADSTNRNVLLKKEFTMGNKLVTEADRRRTPTPLNTDGIKARSGGGQKVSLERGSSTRSKKNPGKRPHKGG